MALGLRWWGFDQPLTSDAGGYQEAALTFHARVAERGTNAVALVYTNMHSAAREPFFPLLVRIVFDIFGESHIHVRTMTIFASVATVYLTYRFGKAALGAVAGLGAAALTALQPWHAAVAHDALREEVALLLVYGLALLVCVSRRPSPAVAFGAGSLAALAILTRIDAAPTVGFLLAFWSLALGQRWRRTGYAALAVLLLVGPLILGYQAQRGEALAPLQSAMGGDMHERVDPWSGSSTPWATSSAISPPAASACTATQSSATSPARSPSSSGRSRCHSCCSCGSAGHSPCCAVASG